MLCLTEMVEHSIYDLWGRDLELNQRKGFFANAVNAGGRLKIFTIKKVNAALDMTC